jgi:Sec-independent protein translocase protein TatA
LRSFGPKNYPEVETVLLFGPKNYPEVETVLLFGPTKLSKT